jgi:serine/alanine adding enzyme
MIDVIEYSDEYRSAWSEYVANSLEATISHQIEWREIMGGGLGHKAKYLLAIENGKVRGVLPLFLITTWWRSRYLISLPWIDYGGICADNEEVIKLIVEKMRRLALDLGAKFVELRSVVEKSSELETRSDKVTFLLDFKSDTDVVWKKFDAKLRNQIRKSEKSNLTAEIGGIEKLNDFYEVFSWKMRDLGTPVWGRRFFELILKKLPETAKIILIKKENVTVASGLILAFRDRLYVPSAASYRSALKFCPNHALYWEVIKYGASHGYKYLDYGRSAVDSNTYTFKKQWVPESTTLLWQYHLKAGEEIPNINPNNPKYHLAKKIWRMLPLPLANILGPRVIRNFP